jgi:hypothetical protein
MSSTEGDRGEKGARHAGQLALQFLIGDQKHYIKNIVRADGAIVGRHSEIAEENVIMQQISISLR